MKTILIILFSILTFFNNLSYGFISNEIQRDSGSACDFFSEIHSLRPIDEEKKLARWPEDPVFQREKPKTQVNTCACRCRDLFHHPHLRHRKRCPQSHLLFQ